MTSLHSMQHAAGSHAAPSLAAPVGVIVINWNGHHDTVECLDSLAAATPRPAHVVVVDNGSSDDSLQRLTDWAEASGVVWGMVGNAGAPRAQSLPWLTILAVGSNRGFSGANNLGIEYLSPASDVRHFLLLNNDAAVAPDFFAEMAAAVASVPGAGLVTGTIYEWEDRTRVWYAGGVERPLRALVLHEERLPATDAPRETEFICGCAMLISRDALRRLGPLPEVYYPGYLEDAEYSFRARQAGLPTVYAPRAVLYHKVGSAFRRSCPSPKVMYWQTRHRGYYVRRNFRGWRRWVALSYLGVTKPVRAAVEVLRGRPRLGWAILAGTFAGFVDAAAVR